MNAQINHNQEIANTILQKIGGNKFIAMTGAKDFLFDAEGALTFSISSRLACNKANRVKIRLTSLDLYEMTFYSIRGTSFKTINTVEMIYFDQLQAVFKAETGMDTHL